MLLPVIQLLKTVFFFLSAPANQERPTREEVRTMPLQLPLDLQSDVAAHCLSSNILVKEWDREGLENGPKGG